MNNKILITGGSSGIGKGIAEHFYERGWDVLITGRNLSKLEAAAAEMPGIQTMEYHSSDEGQLADIVDFIQDYWEARLDILVNNGGHVTIGGLEGLEAEPLMDMYRAHLIGPSLLTSKCLEFLKNTRGQVLNVTSSHGIKAYPQTTAYAS
ncbi:MAG: SDR family oxidoreductase, partial [Muricauda sp. TMED12]